MIFDKHTVWITLLIALLIGLGKVIYVNLYALNPFTQKVSDYEHTDLVFSKFRPSVEFDERIVLVNVGVPDRQQIAEAMDRIAQAGAKVIGVDVIFEGRKEASSDSLLRSVIQAHSNIILADHFIPNQGTPPHTCDTLFCGEENLGFVNFHTRPNYSIRYVAPLIYEEEDTYPAFATAILKKGDRPAYDFLKERGKKVEQINYRGQQESYTSLEISQVLEAESLTEIVDDKYVLMGYLGQGDWVESIKDKFFTPLNEKIGLKSAPDMFGMVIHANTLSMMLDRCYIHTVSKKAGYIISAVILFLLVAHFKWVYSKINPGYTKLVRLIQLAMFFGLFILTTALFYFFHFNFDATYSLISIAISFDTVKIYQSAVVSRDPIFKKKK